MVASAITADLVNILQRNQQDIAQREQERVKAEALAAQAAQEQPAASNSSSSNSNRRSKRTRESELELLDTPSEEAGPGLHQQQRMLPPEPKPNMLNQEMAEAAAKQFKKKEKRIQKACAKLDHPEQRTCCAIL